MSKLNRFISQLNSKIVRVCLTYDEFEPPKSELISEDFQEEPSDIPLFRQNHEQVIFALGEKILLKETDAKLLEKEVYRCVIDGEPEYAKKLTANGEVTYIKNAVTAFERYTNSGILQFEIGNDELLLGLGQYEDGVYNYRNHMEYIYESNMRIGLPFLITTGGYAIFIDTQSDLVFKNHDRIVEFEIDATKDIIYYVIVGDDIPDIIRSFQNLTGKASMLPRWAYGYIQSKERYQSGEELADVAKKFREHNIPIDCIVQDWYSWEDGLWGEKIFDKKRYPDLKGTVDELHNLNTKFMVSIWPNMSPLGENYKEFSESKGLLDNSNLYNAFDEKCRKLYWEQCEREIMAAGTDSLWCDNAEPFSDADWNGETKRAEELRRDLVVNDSKKSMEWEKINAYSLFHAKGIYENWRKTIPEKRVVNLTRSGYISGQKYGTILWSGDICAKWDTIRKQIVEGMKMGLCGNPYWTLDIGAFFTVKDKYENRGCNDTDHKPLWFWNGDFNEGVNDPGYRELYTRWLQFGAFLPIFRSHGTDTPREPWNFINKDDVTLPFYETIVKFIKLRYRILPYIYSLAYMAHRDSYIMMRSFAFDFSKDDRAVLCTNEYMFGPAFLVTPVFRPMYFGPNGEVIPENDHNVKVYLPTCNASVIKAQDSGDNTGLAAKNTGWYDYFTNKYYEGGAEIEYDAPIDIMPLFVREGSIIPVSAETEYSGENNGQIESIIVYEGANGNFALYNDSGDGYEYLNGEYSLIDISYNDEFKQLTLSDIKGQRRDNKAFDAELILKDGSSRKKHVIYCGEHVVINL